MRKKRNVRYYSQRIAKEQGLPEEVVHKILMHGWRNVLGFIKRKQDVSLQGFGRIWVVKNVKPTEKEQQEQVVRAEVITNPWDLL